MIPLRILLLIPDDSTDDDSTTVLDADGDGVADADDTCADTPSGETLIVVVVLIHKKILIVMVSATI